jgi:hypothetical protein
MTKVFLFFLYAPDELRERAAEFCRMPKAKQIEACKCVAAAAFIVCVMVAGYYAPDYF